MRIEDRWPSKDPSKLQLYSMNTPNGIKVSAALEELALPYEPHTIDILAGDQHTPEFLTVSPNGKIPAIVDPAGPGGQRLALMESGAILLHLAEKTGKLLPSNPVERLQTIQWVFFQVGHVGPMLGQFGHFFKFARETCPHPYPLERYQTETKRILGVIEKRLDDGRDFLMGDAITIADFAVFPWLQVLGGFYAASDALDLQSFERVSAYIARCTSRPSYQVGKDVCARGS
jgi:GST-like protein